MNQEKSGRIKEYAQFQEKTKNTCIISNLRDYINFYAAAKWLAYEIRMEITLAGEVKK
jgi:hypothetical protein